MRIFVELSMINVVKLENIIRKKNKKEIKRRIKKNKRTKIIKEMKRKNK
jgi:hypothetical protein